MKNVMKKNQGIICAGALAAVVIVFLIFVCTHTFIDGKVYANHSELLDLQGQEITVEHYDAVRDAFPEVDILWDVPFQGGLVANTSLELNIYALSFEDVTML